MYPDVEKWQARRESNPQPAVLETAALPIELLAYINCRAQGTPDKSAPGRRKANPGCCGV